MDNTSFNTEANKIWFKVISNSAGEQLEFQRNVYNKLFNFFQVGEYFYWVFNIANFRLDFVSNDIRSLLGYEPGTFSIENYLENIHPDDRPRFLDYENKAAEFLASLPIEKITKYKIRYDFRMKKSDGSYIRLVHQSMVLEHDEHGRITRTLGSETDITQFKPEGKPTLSFIGLDGEPSYINVDAKKIFTISIEPLSKREKEVLLLLMKGQVSKEIADILHISKQTVDTHRSNMIIRNKLKNTSELISTAIIQGWV